MPATFGLKFVAHLMITGVPRDATESLSRVIRNTSEVFPLCPLTSALAGEWGLTILSTVDHVAWTVTAALNNPAFAGAR